MIWPCFTSTASTFCLFPFYSQLQSYFTFSSLEGLWISADCLTHSTLCLKFTLCLLCFFLWIVTHVLDLLGITSSRKVLWMPHPPPRDGISSSLIFGSPVPSPMPGTLWGCWTNACWINEPMNESQKWVQKGRTRTGKPICELYRVILSHLNLTITNCFLFYVLLLLHFFTVINFYCVSKYIGSQWIGKFFTTGFPYRSFGDYCSNFSHLGQI